MITVAEINCICDGRTAFKAQVNIAAAELENSKAMNK